MKTITGILLSTLSTLAISCPIPLQSMEVEVVSSPLKFDYSLTSRQMQQARQAESTNGTPHYSGESNLLGLYLSKRRFEISPLAESTKGPFDAKFCSSITKLRFIIRLEPIIYVSREAQAFSCTKQRVEQHEMMHHQYEIEANNKGKQKIYEIIRKYYTQQFYTENRSDLGQQLDQKNQIAFNEIYQYLTQVSEKKHMAIDTPENYREETKLCPPTENIHVMNLIRQGY